MRYVNIRLKVMLAVFAVGMVVGGFAGLGDGLRHPFPKHLTYAEFAQLQPTSGWYDVTGGYLDITTTRVDDNGYYVAFRAVGQPQGGDTNLQVLVTDTALVHEIDRYNNAAGHDTTAWGLTREAANGPAPTATAIPMEIAGVVHPSVIYERPSGSTGGSGDADTETAGPLTIDKDVHPNAFLAIAEIIAGFVMCGVALRAFGVDIDLTAVKEMRNARSRSSTKEYAAHLDVPNAHAPPTIYPPQQPISPSANWNVDPTAHSAPPSDAQPAATEDRRANAEMERLRNVRPFDPFSE
jgi:hypothetical protein